MFAPQVGGANILNLQNQKIKKIIKFDTFYKYLSWKSENKRPCKIWNWTF